MVYFIKPLLLLLVISATAQLAKWEIPASL
jgi:hypothetical protein